MIIMKLIIVLKKKNILIEENNDSRIICARDNNPFCFMYITRNCSNKCKIY